MAIPRLTPEGNEQPTFFYVPLSQFTQSGQPFTINSASPAQADCGAPTSDSFTTVAGGLDLDFDFDLQPVETADTLGGSITYWRMAGEDGQRVDLKLDRKIGLGEGRRIRLVLSAPISLVRINRESSGVLGAHRSATALSGGFGVGLQLPVSANWWVTPRVAYTARSADPIFGGDGELLTTTLASNLRLPTIGRGNLTLANLVGLTRNLRTGLTGQDADEYAGQTNWWFRNGVAYQLPLKGQMFGRAASLRTSYVFTYATGDALTFNQVHEASLSVGLRTRETEQRTASDLLRVGVVYTHALNRLMDNADYDALTLTFGFRF